MTKIWKIVKTSNGFVITWGYSDSKGNGLPYIVSGKVWKTLSGATKWGFKHFKCDSINNGKL